MNYIVIFFITLNLTFYFHSLHPHFDNHSDSCICHETWMGIFNACHLNYKIKRLIYQRKRNIAAVLDYNEMVKLQWQSHAAIAGRHLDYL